MHTIRVNDAQTASFAAGLAERVEAGVAAALAEGGSVGVTPESAEISVTFVDVAGMRELNAQFHQVDEPTDVLAFGFTPTESGVLLGDIYVCPDVAAGFADEHGESIEDELVRLAIHGTLHLLGHDHPAGDDRYVSEMFRLQERLLDTTR